MKQLIIIALTVIRASVILVAIWQVFTIFPAVVWLQDLSAVSENMWATFALKVTICTVFTAVYFYMTKLQIKVKGVVHKTSNKETVGLNNQHKFRSGDVVRQPAFDSNVVRDIRTKKEIQEKEISIQDLDPEKIMHCQLCSAPFDKSDKRLYMAINICPSCYDFKNSNRSA